MNGKNIMSWAVALAIVALAIIGGVVYFSQTDRNGSEEATEVAQTAFQQELQEIVQPPALEVEFISANIPEVSLQIEFPAIYALEKDYEKNRRGSFVSYVFNLLDKYQPQPHLGGIQFYSEESIKNFNAYCAEESPCFFGDYPTVERYTGQKEALTALRDYTETDESGNSKKFTLKKFNGRYYLTSSYSCIGDSCTIGEYTTFIGDTKIDVLLGWWEASEEAADELFKQFQIIEL